MLHTSTQQLILKLCELTDANAIAWKEGERQCSVFETEGYLVEVEGDPPGVRLLRSDGKELERADAPDLLAMAWPGSNGTYASRVSDMAKRAHRVASGAEAAISKILSSLCAPRLKTLELEPMPVALEFAAEPSVKRADPVSAAESAAALAAVTADMETLRGKVELEPPVSHSTPEAPPAPVVTVEADTAIERVLAVQPVVPSHSAMQTLSLAEARPEAAPQREPAVVQPQLEQIRLLRVAPAPALPAAPPKPLVRSDFGATASFARANPHPQPAPKLLAQPAAPRPKPEPTPQPSKVTSTGLLFSGISARTRQTVLGTPPPGAPRPQPAPAPQAEKKPQPVLTGPDVYKPWSD